MRLNRRGRIRRRRRVPAAARADPRGAGQCAVTESQVARPPADRRGMAHHLRSAVGAVTMGTAVAVLALPVVPMTLAHKRPTTDRVAIVPGPEPSTKVYRRKLGPRPGPGAPVTAHPDLTEPHRKDVAMRLVSSAENSSLDWRAQFAYIEDIGDGRGYTAGIIGFCSGTGDMLELVEAYTVAAPGNGLARFLPALRAVNGT